MPRTITVGAAQLGPIARNESRGQVVKRLLALMREAHGFRCDLVAFPELALTTFFPRWALEDEAELDSFYETRDAGAGDASRCSRRRPSSASASPWAMPSW